MYTCLHVYMRVQIGNKADLLESGHKSMGGDEMESGSDDINASAVSRYMHTACM